MPQPFQFNTTRNTCHVAQAAGARGVVQVTGNLPEEVAVQTPGVEGEAGEKPAEDSKAWKRKAVKRRFFRGRIAGVVEARDSSYEPVFQNLREQDGDLPFELPEEGLNGRVLPLVGPEARNRARGALLAGILFTIGLGVAAGIVMMNSSRVIKEQITAEISGPPSPERQLVMEVRNQTAEIPLARETVGAFFEATTPEEKVAFIRGGKAMLPALRRYYASRPDEPSGFRLRPGVDFGSEDGRDYLFLGGTDTNGKTLDTVMEMTPEGPRLDWRFLTGMGEMEWADWVQKRPHKPLVMRAEAVLDDYFTGGFSNSREWLCLRLTDAENTATVWAYTPRMSHTGLTLFRQLNERRGPVRVTVTLEFPSSSDPGSETAPQVNLCRVGTQGWLDRSPNAAGHEHFAESLFTTRPSL